MTPKHEVWTPSCILRLLALLLLLASLLTATSSAWAQNPDYARGLKRASYLLSGKVPTDADFGQGAGSREAYLATVRRFVDSPDLYESLLRYHQRIFGIGLPTNYLEELERDDIDGKAKKFARILCGRTASDNRYRCSWSDGESRSTSDRALCPASWEEPVTAFWRPGLAVWVCPSLARTCGSDLSRCFIQHNNEDEARNSELGTSEVYDSRFTIVKSLSLQAAGIATAVSMENYPYTMIVEPGVSAVDGAIANFYRQTSQFDLKRLNLSTELATQLADTKLDSTRFQLVYTGNSYEQAGVLTAFGYLRRFEKNRTRANNLYERLLCRKFTAELPRVFPSDPGNLRETPGCQGCHATLDPLADFFAAWGEGNNLYNTPGQPIQTTFGGKSGTHLSDLARIIQSDRAFATCTVQNAWEWLMGRAFYQDEQELRTTFTDYFIATRYSFKELIYALATHPAFVNASRGDATVTDPLTEPPLGEAPDAASEPECSSTPPTFAADIQPRIAQCTSCHGTGSVRQPLVTEQDWRTLGSVAVGVMRSGNMPPGQSGPPRLGPVWELKEAVRCWLESQN
jgi:hypothetical protein